MSNTSWTDALDRATARELRGPTRFQRLQFRFAFFLGAAFGFVGSAILWPFR